MNVLNTIFEKVYVITTSHSCDRHEYIKNLINTENLECEVIFAPHKKYCKDFTNLDLWNGIRHDNSAYTSLTSTYYSILRKSIYHEYSKILIFEDDIKFDENYKSKINTFFENVPNDWSFLNLGYHTSRNVENGWKLYNFNDYVSKIDVFWTTHAVAFKGVDFYKKIIDRMNTFDNSIEHILNYFTHIEKNNMSYTPNEVIFTQLSYRDEKSIHEVFKSLIQI